MSAAIFCGCGEKEVSSELSEPSAASSASSAESSDAQESVSSAESSAEEERSTVSERSEEEQSSEDAHQADKDAIFKKMREILDSDKLMREDMSIWHIIIEEELNAFLKENNIEFKFSCNEKNMFGQFSDGTKWGFTYDEIPETPEPSYTREELDAMLKTMNEANDRISAVTDSDEYKNADLDGKKQMVEKLLKELAAEGLIKDSYYIDNEMASYEFGNGGLGGIMFRDFDPMLN